MSQLAGSGKRYSPRDSVYNEVGVVKRHVQFGRVTKIRKCLPLTSDMENVPSVPSFPNMGSLPVTVTLSGSTLNLTATTTGTGSNYSLASGSSTNQPSTFSQPSFTVSVSGSSLTGGGTGGTSVNADAAYAPFGETYAQSGTADPSFTGQNSDTVSGEYDFLYREYSTQGRWPSPDPGGLSTAHPTNPQSWNRYAYVQNNPLSLTDPSGLDENGGSVNCIMDGAPVDCGTVAGGVSMGAAAICPNNDCYNQTLTVNNYGESVFIPTFSSVWAAGLDFSGDCVGTNCAFAVNLGVTPAYPDDGSIMSQIMNNPTLASNWTHTFNGATNWVNAGAIYTGAGLAAVGGIGAVTAIGAGEAGPLLGQQVVYGQNALQADLFHAFPSLLDSTIMGEGEVTYGTGTYIQYNLPGFISGATGVFQAGVFQIGGYWVTPALFYMTHHFFLP